MSAECSFHGVDLLGFMDTAYCPLCRIEEYGRLLAAATKQYTDMCEANARFVQEVRELRALLQEVADEIFDRYDKAINGWECNHGFLLDKCFNNVCTERDDWKKLSPLVDKLAAAGIEREAR